MWNVVVLLFSVAAIGNAQAEDVANATLSSPISTAPMLFFDLPSLSMILDVEKEDNALIPFQDQLKDSMELHLEKFYKNKFLTSEVGIPAFVDVDLELQLLWKELWVEPKEITEEVQDQTYTKIAFVKKYEVRGILNCKIKLQIDPITSEYEIEEEEKPVFVSQSLINIFYLEAFENEHYWDMMHGFLTTPLLRAILSAEVKVLDVDFVHPYDEQGNLRFESDDNFFGLSIDYDDDAGVSFIMVVGVIFVIMFFLALVAIWFYLCVVMKGSQRFLWNKNKIGRSRSRDGDSFKGSSVTRSVNSDASGGGNDDDEESTGSWASSITANLDQWASSITSIPLRDVDNRRRKNRGNKTVGRPYFRPGHEHSSSLDCITEVDNESWCSSVKSSRSGRSSKSRKKRYNHSKTRRSEESSPLASTESFDSSMSSSSSVVSTIIHEGVSENSADDEENAQSSPLLIQRQLIKLIPSEDEDDGSWTNRDASQICEF